LGRGQDETEKLVTKNFGHNPKFKIIETEWDENLRTSGLILSQQTNLGLDWIRKEFKTGWCLHLQADEFFHEAEYAQINNDIEAAQSQDCQAIQSRYLHFWKNYQSLAIARRWYAHETRIIKIDSRVKSFADAQGFQDYSKLYISNTHIYHYGHVREPEAYERKKNEFHRWWHPDEKIAEVIKKGNQRDCHEETVSYFGTHPKVMADRIQNFPIQVESHLGVTFSIYDPHSKWQKKTVEALIEKPECIQWITDFKSLLKCDPRSTVLLEPLTFFQKLRSRFKFNSRVPHGMRSPQARPWEPDFWAVLRLSEKGIPCSFPNSCSTTLQKNPLRQESR
jgi:hypothetical protein